jgi:hypothetical protein
MFTEHAGIGGLPTLPYGVTANVFVVMLGITYTYV